VRAISLLGGVRKLMKHFVVKTHALVVAISPRKGDDVTRTEPPHTSEADSVL
jgi:hypothetical protein